MDNPGAFAFSDDPLSSTTLDSTRRVGRWAKDVSLPSEHTKVKVRAGAPLPPTQGGALSVEAVLSTVLSCIAHSLTRMRMLTCLCITDNPDPERGLFLSKDARGGSFSPVLRHHLDLLNCTSSGLFRYPAI